MAEIINVIWALLIVLSVIGFFAYIAKKSGYLPGTLIIKGKKTRLSVIESKALDARHRLIIAGMDDKEYLLAIGPDVITLIDSQDKQENFKELLSQEDRSGNDNAA